MVAMEQHVDILIVGAGISGIAFASTYLGVNPTASLLLVEREAVLGGTWNKRRLYDYFYTQWSSGFGEFADRQMTVPPKEDQYCGLFKAKHTSNYLEEYADSRMFAGRSLKDRIQFSTLLTSARKEGDSWEVDIRNVDTSQSCRIFAQKFVVASGLTSIPKVPQLRGQESFSGRLIHNIDFGSSGVLADPNIKHVTVLGGGKSGADMIYASAKAGKEVAWIVRPSGAGPCTFVDANGQAGFNNAFELASTRATEVVQPSYFATENWWTKLLHRTRLGLYLSNKIWAGAHAQAIASADYANRPSRGEYNKLIPHTPLFWRNNPAGIVNHHDFYEIIAGSVDSYYDEVKELEKNEIHLESGRTIRTDALLFGTGWQDSLGYLSPSLRAELDLPYPLSAESDFNADQLAISKEWVQREHKADADVLKQYPILANPPPHVEPPTTNAPYRLYNLAVPTNDPSRSFAVIGMVDTTNYFRTGEAQSRWVTAYFDGKVSMPPLTERMDDVAHFVAWCRRRYLGSGSAANAVTFDTLKYTDRLFAQLGLTSHLKTGWAYLFSPNRAGDYKGLAQEYAEKYGGGK